MIRDEFLLTLPSNGSATVFPDNIPSFYKIILPKTLELEGEWEMAIVNIQYPFNWPNYLEDYVEVGLKVDEDSDVTNQLKEEDYVTFRENLESFIKDEKGGNLMDRVMDYLRTNDIRSYISKIVKIPTSYYQKPFDIANYLTGKFNENCPEILKIHCTSDQFTETISFSTTKNVNLQFITQNYRLQTALGLTSAKIGDSLFLAKPRETPANKTYMENLNTMYVYCNAIKYQIVGDTQAPLLATLAIQGKPGEQCFWGFNPPLYIALAQKSLSSLEIKICTDSGELFPFHPSGRVIIQLHLRRHRGLW